MKRQYFHTQCGSLLRYFSRIDLYFFFFTWCTLYPQNEILHAHTHDQLLQSCQTLCNSKDCTPQASSVHGIFQAGILEWVAMPSSGGTSWLRDRTRVSCVAGESLTAESLGKPKWGITCNLLNHPHHHHNLHHFYPHSRWPKPHLSF